MGLQLGESDRRRCFPGLPASELRQQVFLQDFLRLESGIKKATLRYGPEQLFPFFVPFSLNQGQNGAASGEILVELGGEDAARLPA